MKRVYVLLFDGYADWELGNVLAELRRFGNLEVVTVGFTDQSAVSMGGLNVRVDTVISKVEIDDVLIFLVPGGHMWEGSYPKIEIDEFLNRLEKEKAPIAAICAATTVLAKAGILRGKKHTSNSLKYLRKMFPEYSEEDNYVDSPAVRDQHVITASGLCSVDFAMEVFNEINLASPEMRSIWYEALKYGKYPDHLDA